MLELEVEVVHLKQQLTASESKCAVLAKELDVAKRARDKCERAFLKYKAKASEIL
jgi:hypothetical protein